DVRVLDRERFFHGLALDPLGSQRRAGDRGTAAERLEAGFLDDLSLRVDTHLQLHHVAAFRGADEAGAYVGIFFRKAADVARIIVMIYDLVAISHELLLPELLTSECRAEGPGATFKSRSRAKARHYKTLRRCSVREAERP